MQKQQQKYELKAEKIRQKAELKKLKENGGVVSPVKETTMTLGVAQKSIKIGTTQDEVAMALGSPNIITVDSEGYDTWIYDKVSSVATYNSEGFEIGGENTNCVIAAHRGYKGIPMFCDIEIMEIGDEVIIRNLWETLKYRVSDI